MKGFIIKYPIASKQKNVEKYKGPRSLWCQLTKAVSKEQPILNASIIALKIEIICQETVQGMWICEYFALIYYLFYISLWSLFYELFGLKLVL